MENYSYLGGPGPEDHGPPAKKSAKRLLLLFAGLLHDHWFGNLMFIAAVVIGFIHGWLKMRFRSAITTFAFDIPLTIALGSVVLAASSKGKVFPDTRMSGVLKLLLGVCTIYAILPFPPPFLIALAAFRGWCFIPLVFLLGYHLSNSVRQVEFYIWLMIICGTLSAVYGDFFQSEADIRRMMEDDPEMTFRLQNSFYAENGKGIFRRFGTYVSAAQFGGTSAYCLLFAFSRLSVKTCPLVERLILAACCMPLAYAVILSGSRTSLALMLMAMAFTIWYRRSSVVLLLAPAFVFAMLKFGSAATGGSSASRYSTLLDSDTVTGRFSIVFQPAIEAFKEFPLGGGLGRSTHGVPMILMNMLGNFDKRPVDGDLGRVVVEMGIIGFFVLGAMIVVGIADSYKWMVLLRDTALGIIGLPAGIYFILAVVNVPTGSPFLGIPSGALLWFFLGALGRLTEDYETARRTKGAAADLDERFVSFIRPKKMSGLYKGPAPAGPSVVVSRIALRNKARGSMSSKPSKRYLYKRNDDDSG